MPDFEVKVTVGGQGVESFDSAAATVVERCSGRSERKFEYRWIQRRELLFALRGQDSWVHAANSAAAVLMGVDVWRVRLEELITNA